MNAKMNFPESQVRGAAALALLLVGMLSAINSALAGSASEKIPSAAGNPPVIDEQPVGRSVSVGGHVALSVLAQGTAPLIFQWRKDGAPLANDTNIFGATTSVLNIDPAGTNNSGAYSVVITNASGSTTSTVVSVAANNIPVFATAQGNTGLLMRIIGPIGEIYRIETGNFGPPWSTNGYATNFTGEARYFFLFASGGASIRVLFDRMLPVLYSSTPQAPATVRAYGKLNQAWRFERSSDLLQWTPMLTVTNTNGWFRFNDPQLQLPPIRFYRIAPTLP
jgi:hypothetical protein